MSNRDRFAGVEFMAHRDGCPPLVPSTEEISERRDRKIEAQAKALAVAIYDTLCHYPEGLTIKKLGEVMEQPVEGFIPCKAFHLLLSAGDLELDKSTKVVRLTGRGRFAESHNSRR